MSLRETAKSLLARAGFRLSRLPANRFDGMRDLLSRLAARGYAPRLIADVGANRGQWARAARLAFPSAELHLVEPQSGCAADLERWARADGRAVVHPVAATAPGAGEVRIMGGGATADSTGARVARSHEGMADERVYPAATLDALFADRVTAADRVLLKLDIERHELDALTGAARLLPAVEILISEVQFYDTARTGHPIVFDLLRHLDARGFQLLDVAALSSRPRDGRLRSGDLVLARRGTPLLADEAFA
jgi:FkbM family methyltransferase